MEQQFIYPDADGAYGFSIPYWSAAGIVRRLITVVDPTIDLNWLCREIKALYKHPEFQGSRGMILTPDHSGRSYVSAEWNDEELTIVGWKSGYECLNDPTMFDLQRVKSPIVAGQRVPI